MNVKSFKRTIWCKTYVPRLILQTLKQIYVIHFWVYHVIRQSRILRGEAGADRTHDQLLKRQLLYH